MVAGSGRAELERPMPDELDDDLPDAFEGTAAPPPPAHEFATDVPLDEAARNGCIQCGNSCRSAYLWQGDLAFFKENDTKKSAEFHGIAPFPARLPARRPFWGA